MTINWRAWGLSMFWIFIAAIFSVAHIFDWAIITSIVALVFWILAFYDPIKASITQQQKEKT